MPMKTYYLTIAGGILCLITCLTILGLMLYAMAVKFHWEFALIAAITLLIAEQCRYRLFTACRAFRQWKKLTPSQH